MKEVERQASEEWGMGEAQAAVDFMRVEVHAVREAALEFDRKLEEEMQVERGVGEANDTRGNNGKDRGGNAGHDQNTMQQPEREDT